MHRKNCAKVGTGAQAKVAWRRLRGRVCKTFYTLLCKALEVRGFEPLAFSLRTRRSTN
jgi:hypothetical protein